jgi:hypothetical protein
MRRVLCTLPGAGPVIDGVAFAPRPEGGMLSEPVPEAVAAHFLRMPEGFAPEAEAPAAPAPAAEAPAASAPAETAPGDAITAQPAPTSRRPRKG